MKTICCGYRTMEGEIIECKDLIKGEASDPEISHGICDKCYEKFKQLVEIKKIAEATKLKMGSE